MNMTERSGPPDRNEKAPCQWHLAGGSEKRLRRRTLRLSPQNHSCPPDYEFVPPRLAGYPDRWVR